MVAAVLPALFGVAGAVGSALLKKPKAAAPAQPVPLPTMTPRANSAVSDALARRSGSAANQRTGAGGAESSTTAKKSLLGQ